MEIIPLYSVGGDIMKVKLTHVCLPSMRMLCFAISGYAAWAGDESEFRTTTCNLKEAHKAASTNTHPGGMTSRTCAVVLTLFAVN